MIVCVGRQLFCKQAHRLLVHCFRRPAGALGSLRWRALRPRVSGLECTLTLLFEEITYLENTPKHQNALSNRDALRKSRFEIFFHGFGNWEINYGANHSRAFIQILVA